MSRSKVIVGDDEKCSDVSFVSCWSRLKHEAQQGVESAASENAAVEAGESDEQQAPLAKTLTDEDMPDIATLVPDSDYTDFLSPGVSEALRNWLCANCFTVKSSIFVMVWMIMMVIIPISKNLAVS